MTLPLPRSLVRVRTGIYAGRVGPVVAVESLPGDPSCVRILVDILRTRSSHLRVTDAGCFGGPVAFSPCDLEEAGVC